MQQIRAALAAGEYLEAAVIALEGLVAVALVLLTAWGVIGLGGLLIDTVSLGPSLEVSRFLRVLDATLIIFIIIELYRIADAYMRREDILPTVMEAALVAVARKLVTFDMHADATVTLFRAVALALLFIAVGVVWYLLRRSGVAVVSDQPTITNPVK